MDIRSMGRSKRTFLTVLGIALVAAGVAFAVFRHSGTEAVPQRLLLTGSSTVGPLALAMAARYEAAHPGVRIDVETGGSSRGIADAMRGTADIGMASRKLKAGETGLVRYLVARDGLAMIVHASNPVAGLSRDQVIGLYTGKIANWRALGGPDAPVTIVNKAEGRGTLEVFLRFFGLDNREVKAGVIIGENAQGIKTVAANPTALGYVSIGAADAAVEEGAKIKLLALDGVAANTAMLAIGKYKLSRDLIMVTRPDPLPLAVDFLAFATSAAVDDLIERNFFVPPTR